MHDYALWWWSSVDGVPDDGERSRRRSRLKMEKTIVTRHVTQISGDVDRDARKNPDNHTAKKYIHNNCRNNQNHPVAHPGARPNRIVFTANVPECTKTTSPPTENLGTSTTRVLVGWSRSETPAPPSPLPADPTTRSDAKAGWFPIA